MTQIPESYALHKKRIHQILCEQRPSQRFKILDTCRLSNQGILKVESICTPDIQLNLSQPQFCTAAFIPAAGAASRYLQAFNPLVKALSKNEKDDRDGKFLKACQDLDREGVLNWPLPPSTRQAIKNMLSQNTYPNPEQRDEILASLTSPKAFFPCTMEGDSFIQMKVQEGLELNGALAKQFFVTNPNWRGAFENQLSQLLPKDSYDLFEQGRSLSTIRFNTKAEPFLDKDELSYVPAGHGALAKLFPEVKKKYPEIKNLFIKNIDNVVGAGSQACEYSLRLMETHHRLLDILNHLRDRSFEEQPIQEAYKEKMQRHLEFILSPEEKTTDFEDLSSMEVAQIWSQILFGGDSSLERENLYKHDWEKLWRRPLVTMGMVPNSGKDIGGAPVFISYENEKGKTKEKLCIELPHAHKEDVDYFLKDPNKATHFNPVFCMIELPSGNVGDKEFIPEDHPFWILAEKKYKSQPVVYHETLLFEMIGNSIFSNCVFVEIPRSLFNPHKTPKDAKGATRASYRRDQ